MSRASGVHAGRFVHHAFCRRTATEIQRNVVRRAERNVFSRRRHARSDEKAITAWKSDLDEIRRIFDVGLFISRWRSLTSRTQTELEMNADTNVPDIPRDVPDTKATVSGLHRDITGVGIVVPEIRDSVSNVHPVIPNVNHGPAHPLSSVPEVRGDLGDARNTVFITQRNTLEVPGGAGGQNRTVCATRILPITEQPLIPVQSYARSEIPDQ